MKVLKRESLEWAISSIVKLKDGDLFPIPFELEIIRKEKDFIISELLKQEIGSYEWGNIRKLLIPKDEYIFRDASQLDPCDTIFLLAIIFEIGNDIESNRSNISENKVFSYRFNPKEDGQIYDLQDSWNIYWSYSIKKAKKSKFVFVTDIVDYYNQIYHHTIENMLTKCNVEKVYITSIMKLLSIYTAKKSSGIPIGPHAVHLFGELGLIPVDNLLEQLGYDYCRYVDDIHIFCESYEDAVLVSYNIASVLNQNKLVMNRYKTKILTSNNFISIATNKKDKNPINKNEKEIITAISKFSSFVPSGLDDIAIFEDDDIDNFSEEKIIQIFDEYLAQDPKNFSRIKWIIRRLKQTGIPTAVNYFINNLEKFLPAFGDLFNYLKSTKLKYEGDWRAIGDDLLESMNHPIINSNVYLQMIIIELFSKIIDLNHFGEIIRTFDTSCNEIKRKILLCAYSSGACSWLSTLKSKIDNLDVWTRRALIYASQILPKEERKFWLKSIKYKPYWKIMDYATIKYIKSL